MQSPRRSFVWLALAGVAIAAFVRARRVGSADRRSPGDVVPDERERRDELLDEATLDSFPASDPPSFWGRETPA